MVTGGATTGGGSTDGAEIYDPRSESWAATGMLLGPRRSHTATRLRDKRVLVVGGLNLSYLADAQIYDPATGMWTPAGALPAGRYSHTATLLASGSVLVAGGYGSAGPLASAHLYNPGPFFPGWITTTSLNVGRAFHTATLLPSSGKVLVVGGWGISTLSNAELYDPATATWSATASIPGPRMNHRATLLANGHVLVTGGSTAGGAYYLSGFVYHASSGIWGWVGNMATPRHNHVAVRLATGDVLVAGGNNAGGLVAAAEVYRGLATSTAPPCSVMAACWWRVGTTVPT